MTAKRRGALPGFGTSLGIVVCATSLLVLIPLAALILRAARITPAELAALIGDERTRAGLEVSFGTGFAARMAKTARVNPRSCRSSGDRRQFTQVSGPSWQ